MNVLKGSVVLATALSLLAVPALASNKYDSFAGQAMAASIAHEKCSSVTRIGGDNSQQFVFQAAEIAKQQNGLRVQKVRRILFYNQRAWLVEQARLTLDARDVDLSDTSDLCAFARRVAGKEDTVGRFLRRN